MNDNKGQRSLPYFFLLVGMHFDLCCHSFYPCLQPFWYSIPTLFSIFCNCFCGEIDFDIVIMLIGVNSLC